MTTSCSIHERPLSVGQIAERSGVAVSTLHFYETKGLIHSQRNAGNQRRYRRDVLRRVAIIKVAQRLGIPLADIGVVFGYAVIIASDSAGADISIFAHARVANVGEVFSLGASFELGLFHFNKIANLHILPEICAWPQSGERTDARTLANTRAVPAKCACSRQSLRILSSST